MNQREIALHSMCKIAEGKCRIALVTGCGRITGTVASVNDESATLSGLCKALEEDGAVGEYVLLKDVTVQYSEHFTDKFDQLLVFFSEVIAASFVDSSSGQPGWIL